MAALVADRPRLTHLLGGVRAGLLDMDGTLVDSDAAVERAWHVWSSEFGVASADALAIAHGAPADHTVRIMRPDLSDAEVIAAATRQLALQYDDLTDVVAAPGATDLLAVLDAAGVPWAVVTSADRRLAAARLAAAGIIAPVLVTAEEVTAGKPDPEGYLLAARRLGVEPSACLVVEDALPGLEAGHRAGAITVALKGLDGDVRVDGLGQLAALLVDAWRDDEQPVSIERPTP